MKFNRIFLIVLDSLGVGEAIDAKKFNDEGCNTLGHILENNPIDYPNLEKMGFLNLVNFKDIKEAYKLLSKSVEELKEYAK